MPQQVLIVGDDGKSRKAEAQRPLKGLATIAVTTGLVFAAASILDLVLGLALVDWSNPVARFTAVTSAGAALPMLAVGVVTITIVAILTRSQPWARVMMAVAALLILLIAVALFMAAGAYDDTIAAAPEATRRTVRDALIRAFVFGGTFAVAFASAILSLRPTVAKAPPE